MTRDGLEPPGSPAHQDQWENAASQDPPVTQDLKETRALEAQPAIEVPPDLQDLLVNVVMTVLQDRKDPTAHQVHWVHLAPRVAWDKRVTVGTQEDKARLEVEVYLANKVEWDAQDNKDLRVNVDETEAQARTVHLGHKAHPDLQAFPGGRDFVDQGGWRVPQDFRERRVRPELMALLDPRAPGVHQGLKAKEVTVDSPERAGSREKMANQGCLVHQEIWGQRVHQEKLAGSGCLATQDNKVFQVGAVNLGYVVKLEKRGSRENQDSLERQGLEVRQEHQVVMEAEASPENRAVAERRAVMDPPARPVSRDHQGHQAREVTEDFRVKADFQASRV